MKPKRAIVHALIINLLTIFLLGGCTINFAKNAEPEYGPEFAGWKSYSDKVLNVSFMYPGSSNLRLDKPDPETLNIEDYDTGDVLFSVRTRPFLVNMVSLSNVSEKVKKNDHFYAVKDIVKTGGKEYIIQMEDGYYYFKATYEDHGDILDQMMETVIYGS